MSKLLNSIEMMGTPINTNKKSFFTLSTWLPLIQEKLLLNYIITIAKLMNIFLNMMQTPAQRNF